MFITTSPNNNRPGFDDVAILITDGIPKSREGTKKKRAIQQIEGLRKKKIQIIGVAIGEKKNVKVAAEFLRDALFSQELLYKARKSEMGYITNTLASASCKPTKPGNGAVKMTKYKTVALWAA